MLDNRSIISLAVPASDVTRVKTPPEKCRRGAPVQTFHKYFESHDRLFMVGMWECDEGSFTVNFTGHEFAHLLEGEIQIEDESGDVVHFRPGMQLVFPAGYRGTWNVIKKSRKSFIWYELSAPEQQYGHPST
ncbi:MULTISPECIES: cupin domain-containing protein [unclassified Paraburkholderia]|uniref:cupin domain-containing protein n=1 Tax=unclassified Paraburkholderia TaxID=2615204 RepID=UPI0016070440|nr:MULTISPECIES: cupin domain-containing protein [unclassified Paraburkholderia]MBB5448365.1 hypothetical protein [Paraburkholderia sp. WSM4177]MBB5488746.1 hypothetical protein [Paraburkholderia sp. WSM4180]